MKMAPRTEHLFAGIVVKFREAIFGVWFRTKNLARELWGWQNLGETGLSLADRMEGRVCAEVSSNRAASFRAPTAPPCVETAP